MIEKNEDKGGNESGENFKDSLQNTPKFSKMIQVKTFLNQEQKAAKQVFNRTYRRAIYSNSPDLVLKTRNEKKQIFMKSLPTYPSELN